MSMSVATNAALVDSIQSERRRLAADRRLARSGAVAPTAPRTLRRPARLHGWSPVAWFAHRPVAA